MTAPNIVWISTHDINPHLSTYDGVWPAANQVHTPHLDALAAQGVRFDQAIAAAPVCAPSRSAIMTGCYPIAIGTMHMRTRAVPPPEVTLVSEDFRAAGYYTTNNWFTDFQVDTPPTAFDDCSPTAHWRNRPEGAPFFAAFHSLITHESRIYRDTEYDRDVSLSESPRRHQPGEVELPPYHPDTEVFRTAWARYFDLIEAMDSWVGSILRELEEDGLAENTIVVFWSDHGASFPRAKRWANEAGLRVPLIARWPEHIEPGSVRHDVVEMLDLAPTMLHAAGLPVPSHMHGTPLFDADGREMSVSPYAFSARDRMDAQQDAVRTVRTDRYRYTLNLHPDRSGMQYNYYPDHVSTWGEFRRMEHEEAVALAMGAVPDQLTDLQRSVFTMPRPVDELYDIRNDPHETVNLASDPAFGEIKAELSSALESWRTRVGDLGVVPESELIATWRPNGTPFRTQTPTVSRTGGRIVASCTTPGASIGWTLDGPETEGGQRSPLEQQTGAPLPDGRRWNLYTEPVPEPGRTVWFAAWRLGFDASDEVRVEPEHLSGNGDLT